MSEKTEKVNRQDQVKELISTGEYTKKEIAEIVGVNEANISNQMTYLRWRGNFIVYDEDKKLRFVTEEEYKEWEAGRAANRKAPAKARTPEERSEMTAKAIKKQEASLTAWNKKLETINKELAANPTDEDLQELSDEANANITLLTIKIKRNKALAAQLPEYVAPETEESVDPEEDSSEDNEELI